MLVILGAAVYAAAPPLDELIRMAQTADACLMAAARVFSSLFRAYASSRQARIARPTGV